MTPARAWAAWAALSLVLCLPILLHAHVPAVDLPNHLARQFVGTAHSEALDRYYDYHFAFRFNSTADAAWYFVAHRFLAVETFGRLVSAFSLAGFTAGALVVGRVARGEWSRWPLVAGAFVYGDTFFVGFQNFSAALPFAFLAIALWLSTEDRPPWVRALLALPPTFLVFQMHLLAFTIVALAAFGREVHRLADAGRGAVGHALRNLPLAAPWVAMIVLQRVIKAGDPVNTYGSDWLWGGAADRLAVFTSPFRIIPAIDDPGTRVLGSVLPVLFGFVVALVALARRPDLRVSPKVVGPALAVALFALVVPARVDGVSFVQLRYLPVALALFFAGFEWRPATPRLGAAVAGAAGLLAAVRMAQIEQVFRRYDAEIGDLVAALRAVGPGDRVLPVTPNPQFDEPRLWHVQAYAVFEREAFVPTLFQGVNSLEVRPEWREHATPSQFPVPNLDVVRGRALPEYQDPTYNLYNFWLDWPRKFTRVLAFGPLPDDFVADHGLELLTREGRFAVYRVP